MIEKHCLILSKMLQTAPLFCQTKTMAMNNKCQSQAEINWKNFASLIFISRTLLWVQSALRLIHMQLIF